MTALYFGHTPTKANADLDALLAAANAHADAAVIPALAAWGKNPLTTAGLTYGYVGGVAVDSGDNQTVIPSGTLALADNAVNYIERTLLGAVSRNTVGWTVGSLPMALVTTSGGLISAYVDRRGPEAFAKAYTDSATAPVVASVTSEASARAAAVTNLQTQVTALQVGQGAGVIGYDTLAHLNADLAHPANTIAYVTNDATPANNGTYLKSGASGAGAWTQSSFNRVALVENRATELEKYRLIGKVVSGQITPSETVGFADGLHWSVTIAPGTMVRADRLYGTSPLTFGQFTDQVNVTLTAGTFAVLDASTDTEHRYLYCDLTGAIFTGTSIPAGPYIAIAHTTAFITAHAFKFIPYVATNHLSSMQTSQLQFLNPEAAILLDLKQDLGAVGGGVTDDSAAFTRLALFAANNPGRPIWCYIPNDTYSVPTNLNLAGARIKLMGQSRDGAILVGTAAVTVQWNVDDAEYVTFKNALVRDFGGGAYGFRFRFCHFQITTVADLSSVTWVSLGVNAGVGMRYEITDNVFDTASSVFAQLFLHGPLAAKVERNTMTGGAAHNIYTELCQPNGLFEYRGNRITGGITGIFFPSNRTYPMENIIVEGNIVTDFTEEGISFDGLGNDPANICVIGCGTISAVTNDGNGRLVITPSLLFYGTGANQPLAISARADWTNFYFTFDEGSGLEGTVARIFAFDGTAGTLTLDIHTLAAAVTVGGPCGVHGGFFNCVVRNNTLKSGYGAAFTYATALSIYLDIFNCTIENNIIYGGANGINLAGGLMLSTYHTLAYNNIVRGNRFIRTNEIDGVDCGVIRAYSYNGGRKQYGNQFLNNRAVGAKRIILQNQGRLVWEGNDPGNALLQMDHCANTLPAASMAWFGRTFTLITDDGSGNPQSFVDYRIKMTAGVPAWVALN